MYGYLGLSQDKMKQGQGVQCGLRTIQPSHGESQGVHRRPINTCLGKEYEQETNHGTKRRRREESGHSEQ
jgi:hypothetical protein